MKIARWGGPPCPPPRGGQGRPPHQPQPFFIFRCVREAMIVGIRHGQARGRKAKAARETRQEPGPDTCPAVGKLCPEKIYRTVNHHAYFEPDQDIHAPENLLRKSKKVEFLTPRYPKEGFLARLFARQEKEERSKNRQDTEAESGSHPAAIISITLRSLTQCR